MEFEALNKKAVAFVTKITALVSTPSDTPEEILQKNTLFIISLLTTIAGLLWSSTYFFLGYHNTALIPLLYSVLVSGGIVFWLTTKRYLVFLPTQLFLIFTLPFAVQASLGGIISSGAVMVWSFLAPLGAALFSTPTSSRKWFILWLLGVIVFGTVDGQLSQGAQIPSNTVILCFFVMNFSGVMAITFFAIDFFHNQLERELQISRKILLQLDKSNKQLEFNIQRRIETNQLFLEQMVSVTALNNLAQKFTTTSSEEKLLEATGLALKNILGVDAANIDLLDHNRPGLNHYQLGPEVGAKYVGYQPLVPKSLISEVITQQKAIYVNQLEQDEDQRWKASSVESMQSMMLLPINASSAPLGVLTLMASDTDFFNQRIRPLAEQLGTLLGTSLALRRASVLLHQSLEVSDSLLANIFPVPVAGRMKRGERNIADRIDCAGVFFCDLSGFTSYASYAAPGATLALLQRYFDDIELICAEHHIEKIKTIGDAFMAVSGVSIVNDDTIQAMADFALAVAAKLEVLLTELDVPLGFRIGIHAGPLIAGVIGKTRTSFDVWGDTVNMASRLESHAKVGSIGCSQVVYDALPTHYEFESGGQVQMKGKGEQTIWLLLGTNKKDI